MKRTVVNLRPEGHCMFVYCVVCLWTTFLPQFYINSHQTLPPCFCLPVLKAFNFWIFGSKVTQNIGQNSELFSAQATLTHSPAILAQAPLSEPKHKLSIFCSIIRTKFLKESCMYLSHITNKNITLSSYTVKNLILLISFIYLWQIFFLINHKVK